MAHAEPGTAVEIAFKRAEPQLFVTDLGRSVAYFTERMGFEMKFIYGEPPFYAGIVRGGVHLNLRTVDEPLVEPTLSRAEDYLAATICVDSIEDLFEQYQQTGVEFHQAVRTEPWGAKTFIVLDPDGNLILFAE